MDIKRLHYFVEIGKVGSMSEAAERINISQPSLSRQMRLLEEELGVKLFIRHRRGVKLTREGKVLQSKINSPLSQINAALREARSPGRQKQVTLVFGLPPSVGYVLAAPLTQRVAAEAPQITLRIIEGYAGGLAASMGRGEIDIALLYGPPSEWAGMEWAPMLQHLQVEDVLVEDLVLVGPAGSELKPDKPIDIENLANFKLILPGKANQPNGIRAVVSKVEEKLGNKLNYNIEADSLQLVKDYLASDLGYALLPHSAIRREVETGALTYAPIQDREANRQLVVVTNPASRVAASVELLRKLTLREISKLVQEDKWRAELCFET